MAKDPLWLLKYKSEIYSQDGEDGVISKILELIPDKNNWCVEFGAWDGVCISNVCNLIVNQKYSSVMIEYDKAKFKELLNNYSKNSNVYCINRLVGFEENNNLDNILSDTSIPVDFDFLSIDIDGNDYHVWKAISKYQPKVVCIEFNPTIPTEISFIQPPDLSISQGCSLLPLVKLGKEKGYELVSVLSVNAFFVKSEYFPLFEINDNRPEILRNDLQYITYFFIGYDGTLFYEGYKKLLWHNIAMKDSKIQYLPKFIRAIPNNYKFFQKLIFYSFYQGNFFKELKKFLKYRFKLK